MWSKVFCSFFLSFFFLNFSESFAVSVMIAVIFSVARLMDEGLLHSFISNSVSWMRDHMGGRFSAVLKASRLFLSHLNCIGVLCRVVLSLYSVGFLAFIVKEIIQ